MAACLGGCCLGSLAGKWKQVRQENLEGYLKEVGMNIAKRKLVLAMSPTMEITVDGINFVILNNTTFTKQEMKFTIGTPFETDMPGIIDGKFEASPSLDGDKIIMDVVIAGKPTHIIRELVGEELVMTMTCGDVTCKRFFGKA